MRTLRILLWERCSRACPGCCNKQWDLTTLPVASLEELGTYDEIILTGGEPMLYPMAAQHLASLIRTKTHAKIYLYTASPNYALYVLLRSLDGVTITLHDQSDVPRFIRFKDMLGTEDMEKSLRLNVFRDIDLGSLDLTGWKVRKNMEWIENCPLPPNETFKRWA